MKKHHFLFPFILFFISINIFSQNLFPDPGQVFRDNVVPKINILIPADSLDVMLASGNEESNYHWHATFIFDNGEIMDTLENIGFRLRGNTSRFSEKKSFKISFNTYEPGRKWHGLEKLNINGEHNDPTIARSKICWDLLREMDVPASRSNHVRLHVNNQYVGVFLNVEHVDEEFVQLRYGNNDGNLYKCLWPADLNYKGDDPDLYKEAPFGRRTYDLRTNVAMDDYSDIAHFIDVLNNTPINELACELEKVFNVDTYLKVIAFDILSGNWDGPIFNKNNFYLYHNLASGKFEYIPFDLDNTFGIDWFGIDWANRNIYEWDADDEYRPIYERILEVPEYRDRYSFYMNQFLENIYDTGILFPKIENIKSSISPYVESDFLYPLDYGFDFQQFNDSYEMALGYFHTPIGLKEFITERNNSAVQQLALNNIAPIISSINNNQPNIFQDISIAAKIEDDVAIVSAEICYQINGQPLICETMHDDGQHADNLASDGIYGIIINAIGSPATFEYFVQSTDNSNLISRQPICGFNEILIGNSSVPLVVNEFMASNDTTIADNAGEFDDWVELFSLSDVPIYLGNYFLSDNESIPDKWLLPDLWIQPGEYLILWADSDDDQGEFHANFKLSAGGEFIGLFDDAANNFALIDGFDFGEQMTDVASARIPNGTGPFQSAVATPGAYNGTATSVFKNNFINIDLNISPNPFNGELYISTKNNEIKMVDLYDVDGKVIFKNNYLNKNKINTPNLISGIYFLKIKLNNNLEITRKVIFQK